jgi:hypothetical protein
LASSSAARALAFDASFAPALVSGPRFEREHAERPLTLKPMTAISVNGPTARKKRERFTVQVRASSLPGSG